METKNILSRREWVRQSYDKATDYANCGDWEGFCHIVRCRYEIMDRCFKDFYSQIPDTLKREFALSCYIHHGDNYPSVRRAVRSLQKNGRAELPAAYSDLPEITIYRAGEESIDQTHNRLSWTLDIKVAEFFLNEYRSRHAYHLYKGLIKPEKIIAFLTDRNESEVVQYRSVYAVEEIF